MPSNDSVKSNRFVAIFGSLLQDANIWHINKVSISRGIAVGLFCAWLPLPMHMLFAAFLALIIRANLPASILFVWIANPFTMPIMYYTGYKFGAYLLGTELMHIKEINMKCILDFICDGWRPLFLGCGILGAISAVVSFLLSMFGWRLFVIINWKRRKKKKKQ